MSCPTCIVTPRWRGRARIPQIPPEDFERLKWYGLFHRRRTPGYFMLRMRIPGGVLNAEQIAAIGEICQRGRDAARLTSPRG